MEAVLRQPNAGSGRRGRDRVRGTGKAREAFPPPPKARAVSARHSTSGPSRARGWRQSPAQQVPGVSVPRRALGNVPGAVPPHLPHHELMRSAGPGFTLALPPPATAFRSHPEGRSLAGLLRPAARPGAPALFAPSTWFLSALPGSVRAPVIAVGCASLFPRQPIMWGHLRYIRTLDKLDLHLPCWAAF